MDITAIPGLIVDLVRYLIEVLFLNPSTLQNIMLFTAPLALGALCGVMCERSGVVNIALEGLMLISAFAGVVGAGLSGSALVGLLFGLATGVRSRP